MGISFADQPAPTGYHLHSGDKLQVSVWKETELQKEVIINPDGMIAIPLAGDIQAAGKTVSEVRVIIEARLKKYIPDPVVTVSVSDVQGNRTFVIGQVLHPGVFVMNPQMNVLQALSMAGGVTPFAATDDIIVVRNTGAGQRLIQFKYGQVSHGKNLDQNIMLESGDVVVVP